MSKKSNLYDTIIPSLKSYELLPGSLSLTKGVQICIPFAKERIHSILEECGMYSSQEGTKILAKRSTKLKEKYEILIQDTILITYGQRDSLFCALATLRQILLKESHEIPCVKIQDYPDFSHRALMLDISRNRVYNLKSIFQIVKLMSDLKYNELQMNLEGNAFYYASKKKHYSSSKNYLLPSDVKKISHFANQYGILFIPNQNSFGHMSYWLSKEEYKWLSESPNGFDYKWMRNSPSSTLNPLLQESADFVYSLYDDLLPNFHSPYFNIGGDEPFELGLGCSKEAVEKYGKTQVYSDFITKLCHYFEDKNITVQMWGDVIKEYPKILEQIPKDVIALEWGYDKDDFRDSDLQIYEALHRDYYVCPGTSMWNSICGITQNMELNLKKASIQGTKHHAIGYMLTDWGDGGSWAPLSLSLYPYILGGCYSWSEKVDLKHVRDYMDSYVYYGNAFSFVDSLSRYSTIELKKEPNATKLFKFLYCNHLDNIHFSNNLSDPMDIIYDNQYLTEEEYDSYISFFLNKKKELSNMKLQGFEKTILYKEWNYCLGFLYCASLLGKYEVNLYCHSYKEFLDMVHWYDEAILDFQEVWEYRNKKSDLDLSMNRLLGLQYRLHAIIKSSTL